MSSASARVYGVVSPFLGATCSVLLADAEALIVDPGFDVAAGVEEIIASSGAKATGILITHAHLDHVADARILSERFDIPVYVGAADSYRLSNPIEQLPSAFTHHIMPAWNAKGWQRPERIVEVADADHIAIGSHSIQALSLPGHTEGSTGYVFDAPVSIEAIDGVNLAPMLAPGVVFTGDVLFRGTIGRTDLPGGSTETMLDTLSSLSSFSRDNEQLVIIPGHGPLSTLGAELANNRFLGSAR